MDWFTAAVVSAIGLSAQALVFQRLQGHYPINTFMTWAWLGATVALAILFLRPTHFDSIARNIVPLLLAGVASMVGIYAYNRGDPLAREYRLCRSHHVLAPDNHLLLLAPYATRCI